MSFLKQIQCQAFFSKPDSSYTHAVAKSIILQCKFSHFLKINIHCKFTDSENLAQRGKMFLCTNLWISVFLCLKRLKGRPKVHREIQRDNCKSFIITGGAEVVDDYWKQ